MRLFIFILLIINLNALGQEINYFSFNDTYDFNVSAIFDIDESENHIMWFATSEGLYSYDGVDFQKYVNENYAVAYTNLKFDQKGRVWCSNFGGQLFYLDQDTLKLAVNWNHSGDFISNYSVENLPAIRIIGANIGVIEEYDIDQPDYKKTLYSEQKTKILSMSTGREMLFATQRKNEFSLFKPGKLPVKENLSYKINYKIPAGKWSLFGDQENKFVYSFTENGCVDLIEKHGAKKIIDSINLSVYSFNTLRFIDQKIWLLSKKGLSIYDNKGNEIVKNALKGVSSSCVYKDHEGNFWIGSLNRGIFILPNLSFVSKKISENSIAHSTYDESGNVYVMDDQGDLFYAEPPYRNFEKLNKTALEPSPLYYDSELNRLFIQDMFTYYDCVQKKIIKENEKESNGLFFKALMNIGSGFYINTRYSKAYLYSLSKGNFPPFRFDENDYGVIRDKRSHHVGISEDKSGVYIDYIDGLFYYSKKQKPKRIQFKGKDIQTSEIIADPLQKDVVWLSTKTQELFKIQKGEISKHFNLPNVAHKIAVHDKYIFLSTQNGIYRLHKESEKLDLIDETNGWYKGRVTSIFIHDKQCVVVGNQFLQMFPIHYQTKNLTPPETYITSISDGEKTYPLKDFYEFPPGSNLITFSFRALSVRSQKRLTYQYRLAQSSEKWISTSSDQPEARFLNLDAGTYTFEVKACNESNVCSEVQTVSFKINLPFYKKWWFLVTVFLVITTVAFLLMRVRFKSKEKQERLKSEQQRLRKEIYKSKVSAIRAQMNPHFMFNALNTIQEFILSNQQDIASEYLADFADLMRMYLNQSKEEMVSISEEVETLKLYLRLEDLRFNNALTYQINIDPSINKDGTFIPVMLLQPYIENSIKHGLLHKKGEKNLRIAFEKTGKNALKCIIEDNGVGRKESERINASKTLKHESFATHANENRVDLINKNRDQEIQVQIYDLEKEGVPIGTRVEINIVY